MLETNPSLLGKVGSSGPCGMSKRMRCCGCERRWGPRGDDRGMPWWRLAPAPPLRPVVYLAVEFKEIYAGWSRHSVLDLAMVSLVAQRDSRARQTRTAGQKYVVAMRRTVRWWSSGARVVGR